MPPDRQSKQRQAAQMLLLATVFWGVSFPVMKALGMVQQELLPGVNSWLVSANSIAVRFGVAAIILLAWSWRTISELTRLEIWQGLGLGLFGGAGICLQMDGLTYTSASTSAFLTQCYCLILPIVAALQHRRLPSGTVIVCSAMVVSGVAILSRLDWRTMHLGRGEWESLLASFIFTAQILWLERPLFSRNRVNHFSFVMFGSVAVLTLIPAIWTAHSIHDWQVVYSSPSVLGYMSILVIFCTMIAYMMMNYWQPHVPAAEAGLIYCAEPVFASLFALFLPARFSTWSGLTYPNEQITWHLLVGGGLICGANVLIQIRALKNAVSGSPESYQVSDSSSKT